MNLIKKSDGIYIKDSIENVLENVDSIVFDCDGVLIDITESYDLAIIKTTKYVLENFAKINDSIDIDFEIIDDFKATGGFNDEVDLTYAAILSIVAAKKTNQDQRTFISQVVKNADSTGIASVENYLETKTDLSEIKNQLSYPGKHGENPLYQIFDQMFYGPKLYLKLFGTTSKFKEPGLIERDDVILTESLLKKLQSRFGEKIGIVTGRGYESVSYSLKNMLDYFNLESSLFLEDESRDLAKPNPQSLINCIDKMNSSKTIYVGDSMEDFIMAKKVTEYGHETIFCGIIGTSKEPEKKLKLFEQNDANLVLDSINLLPKVLNLE